MLTEACTWLRKFFSNSCDSAIGVYETGDRAYITVAGLDDDGVPRLELTDSVPLDEGEALLAKLLSLARENSALAICLDTASSGVIVRQRSINQLKELNYKEKEETMKWELKGLVPAQKLVMGCIQQNGLVIAGAVAREKLEEVLGPYSEEFSQAEGVLVNSELADEFFQEDGEVERLFSVQGMDTMRLNKESYLSLYGAVSCLKGRAISLSLEREFYKRWKWLRMTGLLIAIDIVFMALAGGNVLYRQTELMERQQIVHQQMALLADLQDTKLQLESIEADTASRQKLLTELTGESPGEYGFLVQLGACNSPGVVVKEVAWSKDGRLELNGDALSYKELADYIARLNENWPLEEEKLRLKNTHGLEAGSISFQCGKNEDNK